MGFRPEPTIYKLNFDDTPLKGLLVRAKCCSMGEYNDMLREAGDAGAERGPDEKIDFTAAAVRNDETIATFARHLVEWNLEDDEGNAVPATLAGVQSVERVLMGQIITAYEIALVTVSAPLNFQSASGKTSEEQPPGMDA